MQFNTFENNKIKKGFHLYLGISNFEYLIDLNPNKSKFVAKLLFEAFDLLLKEIEKVMAPYSNTYIEKISGSRIHCVIEDRSNEDLSIAFYSIVRQFYKCVDLINNKVNKFNALDDFVINVGCDYGYYVDYVIDFVNPNEDNSIGFPCNRAAKIQSYCDPNEIIVSSKAYNRLTTGNRKMPFAVVDKERAVLKGTNYEDTYYSISKPKWSSIDSSNGLLENEKSFNEFAVLIEKLNENSGSVSNNLASHIDSNIVLCDIRGFTKMFNADGSNLVQMARVTSASLNKMYGTGTRNKLNYIQCQGDREAFYSDDSSVYLSILAALELITDFKNHYSILNRENQNTYKDIAISLGIASGNFYLGSVGVKSSKSPLIVGNTYVHANKAEDKYAAHPYSISLHKSTYDKAINDKNKAFGLVIKRLFKQISNTDYYLWDEKVSKETYMNVFERVRLEQNNVGQSSDGGKPWSR